MVGNYLQGLVAQVREIANTMAREQYEEAANLSSELLQKAEERAFNLNNELSKLAKDAQDQELSAFLDRISAIMRQMHDIAQEAAPADAENLSTPRQILQALDSAFQANIGPIIDRAQNSIDAIKEKDPERAKNLGMVLGLAKQTFDCCKEMVNYSDKMDTNEKMYAIAGTVLMVAGIGCLIAATVNPVTGPAVLALTVAAFALHALGVTLAKRSITRHVELDKVAENIDNKLDTLDENARALDKHLNARMPRESVSFSDTPEAAECKLERPTVKPVEQPTIVQKAMDFVSNLFKPK